MPITAGMMSAASGLKNPASAVDLGYRVNLCANPNFESSSIYWTNSGGLSVERSDEAFYQGTHSLKSTVSTGTGGGALYGSSNRIPVTSGQNYQFSVYIKTGPDNEVASYRLRVNTFTAISGGSLISILSGVATQLQPDSEWTRLTFSSSFSDPGIVAVTLFVNKSSSTVNSGNIIYIDNVIFEKSSTLRDYFDGNSLGAFWGGEINASISGTTPY
jgi:hypothetical protein